MSFGEKMDEIEQRAKESTAETKKKVKNAWVDTKASVEKAQNEVASKFDKM